MKFAQLFILILAFLIIAPAKAALLIEPLVGYNVNGKIDIEDGEDYSGGMGVGYGGRLGYQNFGFQLGLDYLNSSLDMDDNDFDKNANVSEWAAFVGFKFPILVKVYAAYIFSANGETESAGSKVKYEDGTGVKLGVGTTILPFLDINLDYRRGTFDNWTSGGTDQNKSVDYSALMLSVSLPFTI